MFKMVYLANIYHLDMLIIFLFFRMVVFVLGILYMSLLYGLYVPDWGFEVVSDNNSSVPTYGKETQIVSIDTISRPSKAMKMYCLTSILE